MANNNNLLDIEEFEGGRLSLCDLPLHHQEVLQPNTSLDHQRYTNSTSNQDVFEFSTASNSKTNATLDNNIIFCGKVLTLHKTEEPTNINNPFHDQRDSIFPLSSARLFNKNSRSYSCHLQTAKPSLPPPATGSFRYEKVNSRKHKVLIGLARIPQKMELSDIKKRQSRRAPAPMFPAVVAGDDELPVAAGNRNGLKGQRGLVRPLKCRAYLASALAKACFRCIPIL